MAIRINAVHHLAISTRDIKAQIEFFSDVLGAELVGLFWMHGVEGAWHAFCRLNDHCSIAFVQLPGNADIEPQIGVSHSGTAEQPSAPGTMQHLAFNVDTVEELLAMRDRIRSKGVNVIGHIDHGICQSIYFGGPEGMVLEVATSEVGIDGDHWIDPEVVGLAGIDAEELDRFRNPEPFTVNAEASPLPQPPYDPDKPHLGYPERMYRRMLELPDDVIRSSASYSDPPVPYPE